MRATPCPDGGTLTIETANKWLDERAARERDLPPGQYVSLCVTDTGTGMTPEVIARAFDPFFTTKPLGQGTGLGLSMIYGFVRQSGGQVRIYSELGKGTTMCLYLPRHYGRGRRRRRRRRPTRPPTRGDGETVLVVDDEPTVRMLIAEVLRGARLQRRSRPATAPPALRDPAIGRAHRPADHRRRPARRHERPPGRRRRARACGPDLKVLFITGYAENAVVGNGHLEPGMEVMTKPFAMDDAGPAHPRDHRGAG